MLKSSQFTRSAVIAATMISLGASPALARQADAPASAKAVVAGVVHGPKQWTQPRVDAMGVRPVPNPVATSPAPAAPLTQATAGSGGRDWLLIPIASLALSLLLIVAVARTDWHWVNPFRPGQV